MRTILTAIYIFLIAFTAFSQADPAKIKVSEDIELIKISENAYVHVSYYDMPGYGRSSANGLVFINEDEAFLFDSPWTDSLTMDLYCFLRDSMKIQITGFIPNHWHIDCMGGLAYLQTQEVESYAHQMTIDIARSKQLPVPGHGFIDSLQLFLGDEAIHCYYPGAAHSMDNIVTWIPSEQILFAGCMVKSLNSDNLGNTSDGDLDAYPGTISKVMKQFSAAKLVIPGHGQCGGPELIQHTLDLAKTR
ncbi:MAG: subclass B1 metallo-beta-lactamase [Bacteroidales bacterium]|nr:subclass B1 metallo-beta-lactamase [Bacteroidales bacterium]